MIKNINILSESEKEIVFSLAILPEKHFPFIQLMDFFHVEQKDQVYFFDTIHDLSTKGFLNRDKADYSIDKTLAANIVKNYQPGTEDCAKILAYFTNTLENTSRDYEKSFLPIYELMVKVLENINKDSFHIAHLCYLFSSNLIKFKRYNEALKYNQMAVDISEGIDRLHPLVALFYRDKAFIHKKLGEPDKSIQYSLKDIEILERQSGKYDDLLPDSYYALSKTYEGIQNYQKAIEYNLKAIKFEKKRAHKKSLSLSNLYHNLAYYYAKLNNLHHATLFINKAVETYSTDKKADKSGYMQLIKDQKRFNSLYEIENMIQKYKIPILVIAGLFTGLFFWIIFKLIVSFL